MKKCLIYLVLAVAAFVMWGCEEEDALLRFTVKNVSDPNNVEMDYHSPDPLHCAKSYYILANGNASELTIRCTNADAILFTFIAGTTNYERTQFTCPEENWIATIVDKNAIKFTFYDVDDDIDFESPTSVNSCVLIQSIGSIKAVEDGIYVNRYPSCNPVN